MKALILAWGFATRLWPITEKRAKPLLLLKNREIISHIVDSIPENIEIIVSTNKVFEEDFLKWKSDNFPKRNIIIFIEDSKEDDSKKWALWATSLVIDNFSINEDLMLIAWDNYLWFPFVEFLSSYKKNPLIACYDIKDKQIAKSFWVVISKDWKKVDSFEEKPLNPSSTLVGTCCYIFPKGNLKDIIFYAKEKSDDAWWIFEFLKEKWEEINVFIFKEKWFDIWSFDWYLQAHKSLQEKRNIEKWVSLKLSRLNDKVYIWENCKIENSVIENSIILNNVTIKNSEIRDSIIDNNCFIENVSLTHKIIREESRLVRGV